MEKIIRLTIAFWLGASSVQAQLKPKSEVNEDLTTAAPLMLSLTPRVIYGDDDRRDVFEAQNPMLQDLSQSTVALMRGFRLVAQNDGRSYQINAPTLGQNYKMCAQEPFVQQPAAAFCSGFLVGPDLIATAGHCIQTAATCQDTAFVFGFALTSPQANPNVVEARQVFRCKKLIHSEIQKTGSDFALVQLDRPVTDYLPLMLRTQGEIPLSDKIAVIGHPTGLPTKITGNGKIRHIDGDYFVASLDTYGGNSGSAVFNQQTGLVEGILVRGEQDYIFENGCLRSNRCAENACRGEDVTKIGFVLPFL